MPAILISKLYKGTDNGKNMRNIFNRKIREYFSFFASPLKPISLIATLIFEKMFMQTHMQE